MCLTVGNGVQVGLNNKWGSLAVVSIAQRCVVGLAFGLTEENNIGTQTWLLPFVLCSPDFPSLVGSFMWSQGDHR